MKKVWFGNIVLPDRLLLNGQVIAEKGKIIYVGPRQFELDIDAVQMIESQADYIWPGLIDIHVHGAGGADVMDGMTEGLNTIAETLLRYGTTGFLATTVTGDKEHLIQVMNTVSNWTRKTGVAEILGLHLEGPWITPQYKGAQNAEYIQDTKKGDGEWAYEKVNDKLKIVTLAPEIPDALEVIKELVERGVIVSIGHTTATFEDVIKAVELGATHVTHTFNAMKGLHHREPGVVGAAFAIDQLYCEVIADGYHVHPQTVNILVKVKGADKVLLVSDGIRAVGMPDGEYELGGLKVITREGQARLKDGTLAGSLLTLNRSVINMLQFTEIPIWDAVKMASLNPAKRLGLEQEIGSIEVGKRANLIAVNTNGEVEQVWLDGVEQFIR